MSEILFGRPVYKCSWFGSVTFGVYKCTVIL